MHSIQTIQKNNERADAAQDEAHEAAVERALGVAEAYFTAETGDWDNCSFGRGDFADLARAIATALVPPSGATVEFMEGAS